MTYTIHNHRKVVVEEGLVQVETVENVTVEGKEKVEGMRSKGEKREREIERE